MTAILNPHCPGCVRCHQHGDGECDGEYFTDLATPVPTCVECPGYEDPALHVPCGLGRRKACQP